MPQPADDLVTRGQNVGKKRNKRLRTACFQRFHDKTVRGSIPRDSTKRGSVELFFYKNEFALVYRLGDA